MAYLWNGIAWCIWRYLEYVAQFSEETCFDATDDIGQKGRSRTVVLRILHAG